MLHFWVFLTDQQVKQKKQAWVKLDPCPKHLRHSLHSSSGQSNQFKASSGNLSAMWLGNMFCLLSGVTNTPKSSSADSHPPVWWELPPPAQTRKQMLLDKSESAQPQAGQDVATVWSTFSPEGRGDLCLISEHDSLLLSPLFHGVVMPALQREGGWREKQIFWTGTTAKITKSHSSSSEFHSWF